MNNGVAVEKRQLRFSILMKETQEVFLVNQVSFHMYLAKLDLKEQEYTNAKMHLEYVIAHGNTMKAVKEAKELLQQID